MAGIHGNPLKVFFEPLWIGLNYLQSKSSLDDFPIYTHFDMTGLSGGGWTTMVYAAIDPRIRKSIPVAGGFPLYIPTVRPVRDYEQFRPERFYQLAGSPDLNVMGAAGRSRSQVQILNRRDDCCFGQTQHDAWAAGKSWDVAVRDHERAVQTAAGTVGTGGSRIVIDETSVHHMISRQATQTIVGEFLR